MGYENDDILDAPIPEPQRPRPIRRAMWLGVVLGMVTHLGCSAIYGILSQFTRHPYGFLWNLIPFALAGVWTTLYVWAARQKYQTTFRLVMYAYPISFLSMFAYLYFQEAGDWAEVLDKPHIHGYPALSMLLIEWAVIFSWIWIHQKGTTVAGIILLNLVLGFLLVNS